MTDHEPAAPTIHATSTTGDSLDGAFLLLIAGVAVGAFLLWRRHKAKLAEAHGLLLERDSLLPTPSPCGRTASELRLLRACPEGDRSYGVEYGVTGPIGLEVDGRPVETECAAFVWWWEEEHTHRDSNGHTRTTYSRCDRVVGMVRVPFDLPRVSIAPESVFERWGIGGRGDFQVESEEFNRHFDVRAEEPELTVRLLDAQFQRFLLELFEGRYLELAADLVVVAGDPAGEDGALYGEVSELPGARRDARLVASRIPASFWRALHHSDRRLATPEEASP